MPDRSISVMVIVTGLHRGGAERHLSVILPLLVERGIEVSVYIVGEDGPMSVPMRAAGIPVRCVIDESRWIGWLRSPFRGFAVYVVSIFNLVRAIRRTNPDICHAFLPIGVVVGGTAAKLSGARRVVASRRSLGYYQAATPWRTRLEQFLMRRMDAVLGNSLAVVRELADEGVPARRLGLIYNGTPVIGRPSEAQRRQLRRDMNLPENALVLLVVANLIPYKGHLDLLAALDTVKTEIPQAWMLLCAGRDDGIGDDLSAKVRMSGLDGNVRFLGDYSNPGDLYRAADISILPSHEEGFSNTLIESMSAGLAVIATNVGGNAEALDNGRTGRLVPAKDPHALAAAILEFARDVNLRQSLGALAAERVRDCFALDHCVTQYERLYRGLVDNRRVAVGTLLAGKTAVATSQ